jgi:hypothetical protein
MKLVRSNDGNWFHDGKWGICICVHELRKWYNVPLGASAIWIEIVETPSKWTIEVTFDDGVDVDGEHVGEHVGVVSEVRDFVAEHAPFHAEVWYE